MPFAGLSRPAGVAVDGAGNVYVTDSDNNLVLKMPDDGSGPQTELPFAGLSRPAGVAVDGAGNVYVTELDGSRVILPGGQVGADRAVVQRPR